jgi:hypothetical protein
VLHVLLRGRRGEAEPVRHLFCGDGLSRFADFRANALTERRVMILSFCSCQYNQVHNQILNHNINFYV